MTILRTGKDASGNGWKRLFAALVLAGSGLPVWAQSATPTDLLRYQPRQKDISITTPTGQEIAACEVQKLPAGYLLTDSKKNPVRKLFSTNGTSINNYAYYKDGVEVYRETDTNGNGKVDSYRWLGTAGSKWGVDADEDGVIESWKVISAEEAGHEAFLALKTGNFARLKAVLVDTSELAPLGLTTAEMQAIQTRLAKAQADFAETAKKPAIAQMDFLRMETSVPSTYLVEATGKEIHKWSNRSILMGSGEKADFIPVGDLILVGQAWKLTAVPGITGDNIDPVVSVDPQLNEKLKVLTALDEDHRTVQPSDPKYSAYINKRVAVINDLLPLEKNPERREMYYKQLCDNLSSMYLGDSKGDGLTKLTKLAESFAAAMPNTPLPAYAKYRVIVTKFTPLLSNPGAEKIQEAYQSELAEFVKTYAKAEDAPYALYQLALSCEFTGKDEEAKRWYRQLYTSFPTHMHAEDAKGSERRLDLLNKTLELAGPELGTSQNYDVAKDKGKIIIVYYWASYARECIGDLARIKKILTDNPNDVTLVTVSLDNSAEEASKFLKANGVPGTHLYKAAAQGSDGMKSPLAVQYGINGIPQMFVVGRDGRVVNHRAQVADLETEIKKAK